MLCHAPGPRHLLIAAIVITALSGSKKLPEAARGPGRSMRVLKSEAKAMQEDGAARHSAAPAEHATTPEPAARVVRDAPGETATARPASESPPTR